MIISELFEAPQQCPECGGISFSDLILAEKKDACYHKVKASAKVWPSAYASGRLVQCRKKGAANYGNKSESIEEQSSAPGTANDINTSGAKSLTKKALGKVGRAFMPTLGYTDAAERLSNKDYTGAGIAAAAGTIGLVPVWPAQVASGGLELVNMARDEAKALGGYDKLAKEIGKNFTPQYDSSSEYDLSYLPENPAQSEGVGTLYKRGKDFVKYLRRDSGITSQDIATQRSVGGKEIPSLGQAGKVVTSPTADQALTKLGGKNVSTTPGPTVSVQKRGSEYEPLAVDVPAYVRQGKPDPSTTPVGKPKIQLKPGETMDQAIQRTKDEQEFGKFLQGQGGQKFGTSTAAPTSGANQVPTIKLPGGQTIPDPARLSPSGQYNTQSKSNPEMDKIMKTWDQQQLARQSGSKDAGQSGSKDTKPLNKVSQWLLGIDEETSRKKREQPEVDYDDEYDAMVARVKKLAGLGPLKTMYDPNKRVYRNMPTAVQPPRQSKK